MPTLPATPSLLPGLEVPIPTLPLALIIRPLVAEPAVVSPILFDPILHNPESVLLVKAKPGAEAVPSDSKNWPEAVMVEEVEMVLA